MKNLIQEMHEGNEKNLFLDVSVNATDAQQTQLQIAFEKRNSTSWNNEIEQYGYGLTNKNEVLTHIRYGQLFDENPPYFEISEYLA